MAKRRSPRALHSALLDLLKTSDGPLTGLELTEMLRERGDPCRFSQVYRTLGQLQSEGAVHKVLLARGYVLAGNPKIWLNCTKCNGWRYVADEALHRSLMTLAEAAGFSASHVHIEAAARCSKCCNVPPCSSIPRY